jgi:hypothetical protein
MKIYNYAFDTGLLLGESNADESPLEPGVWLIPANATTEQPLQAQDGKTVHFVNSVWVYQDIPTPEPEPAPFVPTYKEQRAAAYPSIADQLDLLYHGGMDAWKAAITAVKEEFPK